MLKILLKYTKDARISAFTLEYRVICAVTEQVMQHSDPQFNNQTLVAQSRNCLAGALHGQTGQIVYVGGERKTSDLFIALLEKLKGQYRRAKSILLVVDNYIIHKSKRPRSG